MVVSDLSGRDNIRHKVKERGLDLPKGTETRKLLAQVKQLESRGFQYDNAEVSFDLLVHCARPDYVPPFELVDFMVIVEKRRRAPAKQHLKETLAETMVKVRVGSELMHTVGEGDGPVNALDGALRKALLQSCPGLAVIKLVDYKVRVLEESTGTESQIRVLIESRWLTLADSLEYWLVKQRQPSG